MTIYQAKVHFHRTVVREVRFGMRNIDLEVDLVAGDSNPILQFECKDFANAPVDLTGATVDCYLRRAGGDAQSNPSSACVVIDAGNGIAQYQIESGDISESGTYFCDISITKNGNVETSPEALRLVVRRSNK